MTHAANSLQVPLVLRSPAFSTTATQNQDAMLGAMPVLSQLQKYVAASQLMAQAIALCPQLLDNLTGSVGRAQRDADSQSSGSETYQQDSGRLAKKARKHVREEKVQSALCVPFCCIWSVADLPLWLALRYACAGCMYSECARPGQPCACYLCL